MDRVLGKCQERQEGRRRKRTRKKKKKEEEDEEDENKRRRNKEERQGGRKETCHSIYLGCTLARGMSFARRKQSPPSTPNSCTDLQPQQHEISTVSQMLGSLPPTGGTHMESQASGFSQQGMP